MPAELKRDRRTYPTTKWPMSRRLATNQLISQADEAAKRLGCEHHTPRNKHCAHPACKASSSRLRNAQCTIVSASRHRVPQKRTISSLEESRRSASKPMRRLSSTPAVLNARLLHALRLTLRRRTITAGAGARIADRIGPRGQIRLLRVARHSRADLGVGKSAAGHGL